MDKEQPVSVRTDLAVEAKDMYVSDQQKEQQGLKGVTVKERQENDVNVTYVAVNEEGEKRINKKPGTYVTIYADGVQKQDTDKQTSAARILAHELEHLLKTNEVPSNAKGLIVGLGNWQVTPDALGPMAANKIMVTSHMFELDYETVADGYRSVASVSPGVMGVTGIETSDIIFGIVEEFNPDFVIAVDALASRSVERINETIQLSDTGIHPGSGVNNKRKELSKETLGIPIFAIGVPTVVDAVTITSDTIDFMLKHFGREMKNEGRPANTLTPDGFSFGSQTLTEADMPDEQQRNTYLGLVGTLSEQEKRALIEDVLTPIDRNFMVTPKEVDGFMKDMAHLVASGINSALHETISVDDLSDYTR